MIPSKSESSSCGFVFATISSLFVSLSPSASSSASIIDIPLVNLLVGEVFEYTISSKSVRVSPSVSFESGSDCKRAISSISQTESSSASS